MTWLDCMAGATPKCTAQQPHGHAVSKMLCIQVQCNYLSNNEMRYMFCREKET